MPAVPPGEVLIHAGDLTDRGTFQEIEDFFNWFGSFPHEAKIVIAGNHDFAFERSGALARALVAPGVRYLEDSGLTIDGLKFWGSPWLPWFSDWAFSLERGGTLAAKRALIPDDVAVLITHGPPFGILDRVGGPDGEPTGCEALAARLERLTALKLHLFGHIHEEHGTLARDGRWFVNASICTASFQPTNPPIVIDL
jgi:Icc-related predicted phosphoesterase